MRRFSRRHPRLPTAFPSRGIFAPPGPPGGITGQMQGFHTHMPCTHWSLCCGSLSTGMRVSYSLHLLSLLLCKEVQVVHTADVQEEIMIGCPSRFWVAPQACLEVV